MQMKIEIANNSYLLFFQLLHACIQSGSRWPSGTGGLLAAEATRGLLLDMQTRGQKFHWPKNQGKIPDEASEVSGICGFCF